MPRFATFLLLAALLASPVVAGTASEGISPCVQASAEPERACGSHWCTGNVVVSFGDDRCYTIWL